MSNKNSYPMPNKNGITNRANHINNAFIQDAFPQINPTEDEADEFYEDMGIQKNECIYCGKIIEDGSKTSMHGDHGHSVCSKEDKRKIYLTDISNVLPCCSECNAKKGNKSFEDFYTNPKNREYFLKRLSEDEWKRRYEIITKYLEKSHYVILDDDDIISKDYVLEIKDKILELITHCAISWGANVMKKNKLNLKHNRNKELTKDNMNIIRTIGNLLNVEEKSKITDSIVKVEETSLW